mgnify:CR=1 FL=1
MICEYKASFFKNEERFTKEGYVAGENEVECFSKVHNWIAENGLVESITISAPQWEEVYNEESSMD